MKVNVKKVFDTAKRICFASLAVIGIYKIAEEFFREKFEDEFYALGYEDGKEEAYLAMEEEADDLWFEDLDEDEDVKGTRKNCNCGAHCKCHSENPDETTSEDTTE